MDQWGLFVITGIIYLPGRYFAEILNLMLFFHTPNKSPNLKTVARKK